MPHSAIKVNFIRELSIQLKGAKCRVFETDLRIQIQASGTMAYPDFSTFCEQPKMGLSNSFVNPTVLGEVLSPSTESYDRGAKFDRFGWWSTARTRHLRR